MRCCYSPYKEYPNYTAVYCNSCYNDEFAEYIEENQRGKWTDTPCLTCGSILKKLYWEDVVDGGACDIDCKYAYLIKCWTKKGTPFDAAFYRACNRRNSEPEDEEILENLARMTVNKVSYQEIQDYKNPPSEEELQK